MSYWAEHGVIGGTFFILFLLLFPRLTILFSVSVASIASYIVFTGMGLSSLVGVPLVAILTIAGWICWLLSPRLLIAIAALTFYFSTNLVLVLVSCVIAYTSLKALIAFVRSFRRSWPRMKAEWIKIKHAWAERDAQPTMRERTAAWWEVLGVGRDASLEEIKRAYRTIAKRTHPDTAPEGKADTAAFNKATEAYNKAKGK